MKKRIPLVTVFLIVVLLAAVTPVAADQKVPVGERIRIYDGAMTFTAGTPFNIRHGWIQPSTDEAIGVFDFTLDVNGVPQREAFKWFYVQSGDTDMLTRLIVYNFPEGMPIGTYTFTGHWYAPCQYAMDWLGYPGPCATPNAKVETNTRSLVVTFVP
jgi:hypothetical protein